MRGAGREAHGQLAGLLVPTASWLPQVPWAQPAPPDRNLLGYYQNQSYIYRDFWNKQGLKLGDSTYGFQLGVSSHLPSNEKVTGGL